MIETLAASNGHRGFSLLDLGITTELPFLGHLFTLKVISWSMFPAIEKGDVLEVEPVDQIMTGDVVVFQQMGKLICHRVIGIGPGDEIRTQGDYATQPDPPVRLHHTLGKVKAVVRGNRRFVPAKIQTPSLSSFLRMRMDLFQKRIGEQFLALVTTGLTSLKHFSLTQNIALLILRRYVRFYVGIRAPIRLVRAFDSVAISGFSLKDVCFSKLPAERLALEDTIFLARMGPYPLGTFNPSSGEMNIRRLASRLGLEEKFHDLSTKLEMWVRTCRTGRT